MSGLPWGSLIWAVSSGSQHAMSREEQAGRPLSMLLGHPRQGERHRSVLLQGWEVFCVFLLLVCVVLLTPLPCAAVFYRQNCWMGSNVFGGRFPNQGVSSKHQDYLHALRNQMSFQLPLRFSKSSFWTGSFFVWEILMLLFQIMMHALHMENSHVQMTLVYQSS